MQYSLLDGKKTIPQKGLIGKCPLCDGEVLAKCGDIKIHHWAHKTLEDCDKWSEPETQWHLDWKNSFPEDFREVSLIDNITDERHRADIHNNFGITIEFQHSPIAALERSSREKFYKNLVWVIDGSRLKRDFPRFAKKLDDLICVNQHSFRVDHPEESFPSAWIESPVPVIFDFLGIEKTNGIPEKNPLYCLIPKRIRGSAIVEVIPRGAFVKAVDDGQWLVWIATLIKNIEQVNSEIESQLAVRTAQQFIRPNNWGRRRGRRL